MATAVVKLEDEGIRAITAGQFTFADSSRRVAFEGVVERGLRELGALLRLHRVLSLTSIPISIYILTA